VASLFARCPQERAVRQSQFPNPLLALFGEWSSSTQVSRESMKPLLWVSRCSRSQTIEACPHSGLVDQLVMAVPPSEPVARSEDLAGKLI
jgi:hypothetical protein